MYFFIRYFALDFALTSLNPLIAALLSLIGLYLLLRINLLLMLCVTTNAGSIKYLKSKKQNFDRWRQKLAKKAKFNEEDFTTI